MKFKSFIKESMPAVVVTILCLIGVTIFFLLPPPAKEIELPLGLGIVAIGGPSMLALYAYLEYRMKKKAEA